MRAACVQFDPLRVGQPVALRLDNRDNTPHTFTIKELNIDIYMPAEKSALASTVFNISYGAFAGITTLCAMGFRFSASKVTLICGLVNAVTLLCYNVSMIQASRKGSYAFQMIAMGKPVIMGDNAANRELLTHGVDSWFCEMNNPRALAEAISTLLQDRELSNRIAGGALKTYQEAASSKFLKSIVQESILDALKPQG